MCKLRFGVEHSAPLPTLCPAPTGPGEDHGSAAMCCLPQYFRCSNASEGLDLPFPFGLMSDPGAPCKQTDYKYQASSPRQVDAGNESFVMACADVLAARGPLMSCSD